MDNPRFLSRYTDHYLSQMVLDNLGWPMAHISERYESGEYVNVYYGILRGCAEAIKADMAAKVPFLYVDHGYFGYLEPELGCAFYRIIAGGLHSVIPEWPKPGCYDSFMSSRLKPARLPCKDRTVILVPPSTPVADFFGMDRRKWIGDTGKSLGCPTVLSNKGSLDLAGLMVKHDSLVAHSSTAAVQAMMEGLTVCCTAPRAPIPSGGYDRRELVSWLAERQFSLAEMRMGQHLDYVDREIGREWKRA